MYTLVLIFHIIISIVLIILVLFQQGKGADAGAAFGSGSSGMVLGARSTQSFLSKLTMGLSITFFVTSLILAFLASSNITSNSVVDSLPPARTSTEIPDLPKIQTLDKDKATTNNDELPTLP